MDRELICLLVCFLVGIFLFYLLRSSCGCQVVEGSTGNDESNGNDNNECVKEKLAYEKCITCVDDTVEIPSLITLPSKQEILPISCQDLDYDWDEGSKVRGTLYDMGLLPDMNDVEEGEYCDEHTELCKASLSDFCQSTFTDVDGKTKKVSDKCCATCKGHTPT